MMVNITITRVIDGESMEVATTVSIHEHCVSEVDQQVSESVIATSANDGADCINAGMTTLITRNHQQSRLTK